MMTRKAKQLSLMAISTDIFDEQASGGARRPPLFMVQEGDLWRRMGSPESIDEQGVVDRFQDNKPSLEAIKTNIDETLQELLDCEPFEVETREHLKDLGKAVFKALLPKNLRDQVKRDAGPSARATLKELPTMKVYSHAALEWIPWELMHDGKNFLGLRYQIARLPILAPTEIKYRQKSEGRVVQVRGVANLLAEGLLKEDSDRQHWEDTFAFLKDRALETRWPNEKVSPGHPRLSDVGDVLALQDIVYITCHGVPERADCRNLVWQLKESIAGNEATMYVVKVDHLSRDDQDEMSCAKYGPMVFGNACGASGQGSVVDSFGRQLVEVYGATAYVGALAKVTKHLAIDFAHRFYRHLLNEDLTIGEALWQTKNDYECAGSTDPSWLFYCLWGLPDMRFRCKTQPPE